MFAASGLLLICALLSPVAADADAPSFQTATGVVQGASQVVSLADGKILAVYYPDQMQAGVQLVRFNADGSTDGTFAAGDLGLSYVSSVLALPGGQVLIAGEFGSDEGTDFSSKLLRLNADGTLDAAFQPGDAYSDNPVVLPDGKLLLLTQADDGTTNLVRLNVDGTPDSDFSAGVSFDPALYYALQTQADGSLLISADGSDESAPTLVRLTADGALDAAFDVPSVSGGSFTSIVSLASGKVAVALANSDWDDNEVWIFNADGSLDSTFGTRVVFDGSINSMTALPDGGVIVGGDFTVANDVSRNSLAHLAADGSLDLDYSPLSAASGDLWDVSVTPQGDAYVVLASASDDAESFSVDHFDASGVLVSNTPLDAGFGYSLVARADGSGVFLLANSMVIATAGPLDGTVTGGGGFFPPAGAGAVVVSGRPRVTVSTTRPVVYSGSATAGKFILRRTGGDYSKPLRVVYHLEGSAVMGRDYRFVKRVRTIAAGHRTARISIRPPGRRFGRIMNGRAHVTVTLLHRAGYRLGTERAAKIKLVDPASIPNHHG